MAKAPDVKLALLTGSSWITVFKNLIWVVVGAVAVLGGAAAFLLSIAGPLPAVIVGFGATLTLGFGLGIVAHRALAQSRDTPLGYRIKHHEATYSIDSRDIRKHRRQVSQTIQAKRKNVNLVEGRYRWTGEGKFERHVGDADDVTVMKLEGRGHRGWEYYLLHFPPMMKWRTRKVSSTLHLSDDEGQMEPYFLKAVTDYVDVLVLSVELPPGLVAADTIRCVEEKQVGGAIEPIREWEFTHLEATGSITATFKPIRKGNVYGFRWDWPRYKELIAAGEVDFREKSATLRVGSNDK